MNLTLLPDHLSVCQLSPDDRIPAWASGRAAFIAITRTHEELSIVCPTQLVPASVKKDAGWRGFKVEGPLDFALTGILASLALPLAQAGISIFAVATFNTDYVLVKADKVGLAAESLRAAGHRVNLAPLGIGL